MKANTDTTVVIHGLNTKPDLMRDIIELFHRTGNNAILVTLPGHGSNMELKEPLAEWRAEVLKTLLAARELAGESKLRIVGFSLGGALATLAASERDAPKIDELLLLAPALGIRGSLLLLKIGKLPFFSALPIPSFAPPSVRRWCSIPAAWYSTIPEILQLLEREDRANILRKIPATVVLNPRDELISESATQTWLTHHGLQSVWTVEKIRPENLNSDAFQHNIVEQRSVGENEWNKLSTILLRGQGPSNASY